MMTIKNVKRDGYETIVSVASVNYDPVKNQLVGLLPDLPAHVFDDGIAYVMNERGQTVSVYNLRAGKK